MRIGRAKQPPTGPERIARPEGIAGEGIAGPDEIARTEGAVAPGPGSGWHRDGFWPGLVHACTPLAIWAGHFFAAYGFVAIGCRAGLDAKAAMGIPLLTLGLAALTVPALAWLALILTDAGGLPPAGDRRRAAHPAGADAFRSGAAVLSLVAVAWTAAPILLFSSCLQ